ncbi:unnamed protein product [Phytophthora fragariaefolia]|uniref:Unnamed protein product n=1 Tax=Phytophthora fragariaefolia TaxID=1490495 RepID=A0A9W6U1K6_9STRA|nr:unnamed protein product [Phytophthora fragariaefolia]
MSGMGMPQYNAAIQALQVVARLFKRGEIENVAKWISRHQSSHMDAPCASGMAHATEVVDVTDVVDDTDVSVDVDAAMDHTGVAVETIPAPETGFDPVEVDQEEGDEQVTPAASSGLSAVELQVLETFDAEISTQHSVVSKCSTEVGNIPSQMGNLQSQMGTNPSDSSDPSDVLSRPPDDENRPLHGPHVPDLGSHPVRLRDDDDFAISPPPRSRG